MKKREKKQDQRGTKLIFYALREEAILEDEKMYNEIMVTKIQRSYTSLPRNLLPKKQKCKIFLDFRCIYSNPNVTFLDELILYRIQYQILKILI